MTSLGIFHVRPGHADVAASRLRRAGVGFHEDRHKVDLWKDSVVFAVIDDQVESAAIALREVRT